MDDGELSDLYRRHVPAATRLAFLILGDEATAQDCAHDAFLRSAPRIDLLDQPDRFSAYLRTATVRACRSAQRSAARRSAREQRAAAGAAPFAPPPDPVMVDGPLWDAVRALPARQRAALVLAVFEDLDDRAIGATLGCRPATARSLLHRARTSIRENLDARGGTEDVTDR